MRLSDLYVGVNDDGTHDFTTDAKIVMDAFELIHEETHINVISFIRGDFNIPAIREFQYSTHFGAGQFKERKYWDAVIEQLKKNDFLEARAVEKNDALAKRRKSQRL